MAAVLVAARDQRDWSLRRMRAKSAEALWMFTPAGEETRELPPSVLTGLEKGSSWPKFNTLAAAALTLAQRVQVAAPWTAATPGGDDERVDPADLELSAREDGHLPARAWQEVIMLELRNRMVACGTSQFEVAREVGLRPNTVTELSNQHPTDFRYASVRTLLAIASHLGARLEVAPADAPWRSRRSDLEKPVLSDAFASPEGRGCGQSSRRPRTASARDRGQSVAASGRLIGVPPRVAP